MTPNSQSHVSNDTASAQSAEEGADQIKQQTLTTMPDLTAQIEGVLFVEAKSITFDTLAKWLNEDTESVVQVAHELAQKYEQEGRGLRIVITNSHIQMTTAPELHDTIASIIKDERTGELTKPSLETLAIIAYRSPVTKSTLEMIRGVNCSLILRNLLIRGLIQEEFNKKTGVNVYDITPEYLQLLGMSSVKDLPNYEALSRDLQLGESLGEIEDPADFFSQLDKTSAKVAQNKVEQTELDFTASENNEEDIDFEEED